MRKPIFVILGIMLMITGLFINSALGYDQIEVVTDEEKVMEYMVDHYGENKDYEIEVINAGDTEYIHYHYTVNGQYYGINSIER